MGDPNKSIRWVGAFTTRILLQIYPLLLIVAAWEIAARLGLVRALFLPSFTAVVQELVSLGASGELIGPLLVSLYRALAGFLAAIVIGTSIGILMARSRLVDWGLSPLVSIGFPAPKIAFVPIFILWFGIDDLSKILLVVVTCVFPMIVASYHGAQAVSRIVIWSAQAMGTSEQKILYRIVLPAALPSILTGVRVTLPVALITAFTAEMIAGGGGVGAAMMYAQRFFLTPAVFAYILLMLAAGIVLDHWMVWIQRRLIPWADETPAT